MTFELLPILDLMYDLYQTPRSGERFQNYLKTLQGNTKGDLAIPVAGFNPMAKEHIIEKLNELKKLNAEQIVLEVLPELNSNLKELIYNSVFKIALNVSDDLKGGWTNHYTSDYAGKFKINALVNRNFCTPILWSSELFTKQLLKERVLEYAYRTAYWLMYPKPKTLKEHIDMERFAADKAGTTLKLNKDDLNQLNAFYIKYQSTEEYHIIFNFLYGSNASKSLNFPVYEEIPGMGGFNYAKSIL